VSDLKILTLDIETRPSKVYQFDLRNDGYISLDKVIEPGYVICFAAKWYGQKKVMFHSEYDPGGREEMAFVANTLFDQADVVVGYNSAGFDVKHLQAEIETLQPELWLPSPWIDVDLYKVVRKNFRFLSHRLQHVAEQLDIGSKLQHSGFGLWRGWMEGDPKAIRTMTRYCKQDVVLTEELFERLKRRIKNLPSTAAVEGIPGTVCLNCLSRDLVRYGWHHTPAGAKYQRYRCNDCGKVHTARSRAYATTLKGS
jgi:DNA polymerase elongation subunit (family B)